MSVATGPFIVNSGLVFNYDMNNTRSFVGPPLTNSQWNNASEVTPWTVGGTNTDVTGTANQGPVANAKTWKFVKTGTSNQWNGWESNYGTIWTGNAGDIWTTSYWYKTSAPAGNTGFGVGYFYTADWARAYNVTILADRSSIIADGTWRWNYTVTRINEAYTNAIIVDGPSWGYSTQAGELYINGLQWNKNSYAGSYAAGTRSNTQSILDLTNNNTVTATSLTYAYDGSNFSYNGTSDYIECSNLASSLGTSMTVCTFAKISSVVSKNTLLSLNGAYNFFLPGNRLTTTNQLYWDSASGWKGGNTTSWNTNQWYYLSWTISGTTLTFYVNGVADGSTTLAGNIVPANPARIGFANAGEYATGSIGTVQVYNRALSAQEISQNFQAQRGAYGI